MSKSLMHSGGGGGGSGKNPGAYGDLVWGVVGGDVICIQFP